MHGADDIFIAKIVWQSKLKLLKHTKSEGDGGDSDEDTCECVLERVDER